MDSLKNSDSTDIKVKKNKSFKLDWKFAVAAVVALAALGVAFFFWQDARDARSQTPAGIQARNQEESTEVIDTLNELIIIDSEDQPTVAKIENPDVLREANDDFYKNAQAGDYIILYPKRAIILRLEQRIIVNIAPIINTNDLVVPEQATPPEEAEDEATEAADPNGFNQPFQQ